MSPYHTPPCLCYKCANTAASTAPQLTRHQLSSYCQIRRAQGPDSRQCLQMEGDQHRQRLSRRRLVYTPTVKSEDAPRTVIPLDFMYPSNSSLLMAQSSPYEICFIFCAQL